MNYPVCGSCGTPLVWVDGNDYAQCPECEIGVNEYDDHEADNHKGHEIDVFMEGGDMVTWCVDCSMEIDRD